MFETNIFEPPSVYAKMIGYKNSLTQTKNNSLSAYNDIETIKLFIIVVQHGVILTQLSIMIMIFQEVFS